MPLHGIATLQRRPDELTRQGCARDSPQSSPRPIASTLADFLVGKRDAGALRRPMVDREGHAPAFPPEASRTQACWAVCLRGSVAEIIALTDFWLKPLKPPRRWRVSKWLPIAPSARKR